MTAERELDSRRVGEYVMAELRKLDHVAYVRFASVYRAVRDVADFRECSTASNTTTPPRASCAARSKTNPPTKSRKR
jgi:transcriptional repressor NrdR